MSTLVEPPPYFAVPDVFTTPLVPQPGPEPKVVKITVSQAPEDKGSFLRGNITIIPSCALQPFGIRVSIYMREQIRSINASTRISHKRSLVNTIVMPYTKPLTPGWRYVFPYSIQFPLERDSFGCQCAETKCRHTSYPPSHNVLTAGHLTDMLVSVSYHAQTMLIGTPLGDACSFELIPSFTSLDLSTYLDNKCRPLQREYSSQTVMRPKLWGTPSGTLLLSGHPVYHCDDSRCTGYVPLTLQFIDRNNCGADLTVSKVTYAIDKLIYYANKGMGNVLGQTDAVKLIRYKLKKSTKAITYCMRNNFATLVVPYHCFGCAFPLTLSYVACLTAVLYEIKITIKFKSTEASLALPMVLKGSELPAYYDSITPTSLDAHSD